MPGLKALRIRAYQDTAVYRTPWSFENVESFPLPPFSTVLGFIHRVLCLNETLHGIKLGVQGRYGGIAKNFVRYYKYDLKKKQVRQYPILITTLTDVELVLHVVMPNGELHDKLKNALFDPPIYPYLGRPEDLLRIEKVEDVEIHKVEEIKSLKYDAYVPYDDEIKELGIFYRIPFYYEKTNERRNFQTVEVLYIQGGNEPIQISYTDGDFPVFLV